MLAKTLALQRLPAFLALDMLVWRAMLTADANPLRAQALVVEIVHQQLRLTKVYCSEFHLSLMAPLNRFERTREPRVTPSWGQVSRPYSGLVSRPRMAPSGTPCRATAYQRIVSVPRQAETSPPPPRRHSRIVTRSATQQEQELNVTVHAPLPPFRGTARAVRFGTLISHACQEYENDNCTKLNIYASSGDETGTNRFSEASFTRMN